MTGRWNESSSRPFGQRRTSVRTRLVRAGFDEVDRAGSCLHDEALSRLLPLVQEPEEADRELDPVRSELVEELSRVADPDLALLSLVRLASAVGSRDEELRGLLASLGTGGPDSSDSEVPGVSGAGASEASAEEMQVPDERDEHRRRLLGVLGASRALGDFLISHPDHLAALSPAHAVDAPDQAPMDVVLAEAVAAALDPDGTGARRRRDTASRHVSRPRPAGTGVSEMRLLMPTLDAFLLDATLDAVAASARAGGDERTAPQLRCDALTGMCLDTLRRSQRLAVRTGRGSKQTPTPPAGGAQDPGAEHRTDRAERRAEGAERASGTPGTDRPPGPEATGPGRLLPDGVPLEGLLTELSHLVGSTSPWWTPSGTGPVHPAPGLSVAVDVTVPLDRLIGRPPEPGRDRPPGTAPPDDPPPGPPPIPRVSIGGRTAPVPDAVARALAAGGTWRRLVTDPLSGAVIDVGRTRYRPPAALADLVRARDGACTHPGCAVPARRCDLDHITPWSGGGTTGLDNLTALCRTHHRLKHAPGWTLTRTPDGDLTWTTPTGARYRRNRDATITALPGRVGPHHITLPAAPVPDHLARALTDTVIARLEHGLNHYADNTGDSPAPATDPTGPPQPVLTTRGPGPATAPGAYETTPHPAALHALGLTAILDAIPPY